MTPDQFHVEWRDGGKEPQCAPNPDYPNGIDLDLATRVGEPSCTVRLPYPAKRIGVYVVTCRACRATASCTTAGRVDDPRSMTLPCRGPGRMIDGHQRMKGMQ